MANLSGVNKYFSVAKEGFVTTTSAPVASGATTVQLTSVAGYSNGDTVVLVIDAGDVNKKQAFTGVVDTGGLQITNVVWTEGANTSHILGAPVIDYVTASHQSMTTKGLLVSHNQDGTLKTNSVDSTQIKANAITTPKLADDSVTADKVDFTTGIWWEELGRTTLSSSSDTITVSSIPARKYLQIRTNYSSVGGTISAHIRFNNDGGANYAHVYAQPGGSAATTVSDAGIIITGPSVIINQFATIDVFNVSNKEKLSQFIRTEGVATGAGVAPNGLLSVGKWANTSTTINRIDIVNLSGSGDFAIGSELVVLGKN